MDKIKCLLYFLIKSSRDYKLRLYMLFVQQGILHADVLSIVCEASCSYKSCSLEFIVNFSAFFKGGTGKKLSKCIQKNVKGQSGSREPKFGKVHIQALIYLESYTLFDTVDL